MSELERLLAEEERLLVGLLAQNVIELTSLVGMLNAIVGSGGGFTDQHMKIREALLDIAASAMRVGDHFAPPSPSE